MKRVISVRVFLQFLLIFSLSTGLNRSSSTAEHADSIQWSEKLYTHGWGDVISNSSTNNNNNNDDDESDEFTSVDRQ